MKLHFVLLFLLFVASVKASQNETLSVHLLSKRGARDCRGGSGDYKTYRNTNMNNGQGNAQSVADCFENIRRGLGDGPKWGCKKASHGNCRCVADSSFINNYRRTLSEALSNLRRGSDFYKSIEAERYEGAMYVSYTC